MQRTAHISLLGDNEIAREGLKRLLEEGGFRTECAQLDQLENRIGQMPDEPNHIIFLDTQSAAAAIAATTVVRERLKQAKLVLLDAGGDLMTIRAALAQGVNGYFAREVSCLPLLLMLDLVALGETVLPQAFLQMLADAGSTGVPSMRAVRGASHGLSERELGILRCLVDGDSNKIIARKLGITEATVKIHIKSILRKLDVCNRTQAAIWVMNENLFETRNAAPAWMHSAHHASGPTMSAV